VGGIERSRRGVFVCTLVLNEPPTALLELLAEHFRIAFQPPLVRLQQAAVLQLAPVFKIE
jgi:hypothetical protein